MIYLIYLILVLLLFMLDYLSKQYIMNHFTLNQSFEIIKGFFNIRYVRNTGAGFSIFQDQRIFLTTVSLLAVILLSYMLYKENKKNALSIFAYLLLIAGALGNLYERALYGSVTDFLDFIIFGWDYPVFNVADIFVCIGAVILIFVSLKKEDYNAKS